MNVPMNVGSTRAPRVAATSSVPAAARTTVVSTRSAPTTPSTSAHSAAATSTPAAVDSAQPGWLPSQKLKSVKCADPFASKATQFKTKFGSIYNSGSIPCRLNHGAVKIKLQWSQDPSTLDFDPLLVTCAEGLCETEHPYAFAARECFKQLLATDIDGSKSLPLVSKIVPSLRAALVSANRGVFEGGVDASTQLSEVVGEALNTSLHLLVVPMHKRSGDKELGPKILKALQTFEQGGAEGAYKVIKSKVPTYCSIHI